VFGFGLNDKFMMRMRKILYFFCAIIFFQEILFSQEYSLTEASWAVKVPLSDQLTSDVFADQKDSLTKTVVRRAAIKELVQQIEKSMNRHDSLKIPYPDNFQRNDIEALIVNSQKTGNVSQLFLIYHILIENIDTVQYDAQRLLEQAELEAENEKRAALKPAIQEQKDSHCCCICQ